MSCDKSGVTQNDLSRIRMAESIIRLVRITDSKKTNHISKFKLVLSRNEISERWSCRLVPASTNTSSSCFLLEPGRYVRGERANLKGLVNGCIEAKFCDKICVEKLSPRSTKCTPLHRSRGILSSIVCLKIAKKIPMFLPKFAK